MYRNREGKLSLVSRSQTLPCFAVLHNRGKGLAMRDYETMPDYD